MIDIKDWASGVAQANTIQAIAINDIINLTVSSRPLKNLYSNDSKIIQSIDSNIDSSKLIVNSVYGSGVDKSIVFMNDVIIKKNMYIYGSKVNIYASDLKISDSVITLNHGEINSGVTLGKAGFIIDRDNGDNFASNLFYESDKYWYLSNNGISIKDINIQNLQTETSEFEYITIKDLDSVLAPDTGKFRFYLNEDGDKVSVNLKLNSGINESFLYNKDHYIYSDYIDSQDKFNKYFGSELAGSGVTYYGWDYSVMGGITNVFMNEDYNLLIRPGTYNLTTKVHLQRGVLHGEGFNDCIIKIHDSHIGFIGSQIEGVNFDRFTIFGSNLSYPSATNSSPLFTLDSVNKCKFLQRVKNIDASSIYNASNCNGLILGDVISCVGMAFKNIDNSFYNGVYLDNYGTFESCTGIKEGFFSDSAIFGIGEWDDIEESQAAVNL